jgi:TolA-binding protein
MAAKRRIRKHDPKEDHFVTATFQMTTYIREHQSLFLAIAAGVILVAIVGVVISASRGRAHENASKLLGEASISYKQGNLPAAAELCQTLLDMYGSTQQASAAVILLAESYFAMTQYQQAIEAYQRYLDKYHDDDLLAASSLTGIATCHEQEEEFLLAGEFYLKAATEYPEYFAAPEALLNAGRCFREVQDMARAEMAYTSLIDRYPENPMVSDAKMALAEILAGQNVENYN